MATIQTDNIGSGGYPIGDGFGGQYIWLFAIIFLFVIFVIFFRHDGKRDHNGDLAAILPGLIPTLTAHKGHGPCAAEDWKLTELLQDQAKDTGTIIHALDQQTCDIKDKIGYSIDVQRQLALEAERQANSRWESDMRDKLAERDRIIIEKNAAIMAQAQMNNTDSKFCILQNELTNIRDKMLKAPQYIPFGGVAASNPCVPNGCFM